MNSTVPATQEDVAEVWVVDFSHEFMAALDALGIRVQIRASPVEVER
jgi:hypothetical protein